LNLYFAIFAAGSAYALLTGEIRGSRKCVGNAMCLLPPGQPDLFGNAIIAKCLFLLCPQPVYDLIDNFCHFPPSLPPQPIRVTAREPAPRMRRSKRRNGPLIEA